MAHAQKPDFVFPRNRRVHLNRWGGQFSRLLAAEVCASVVVMLDRPRSEMASEYWLPTPFASFPFTSPPVRHRVPPGSKRALPCDVRVRVTNYHNSLRNNPAERISQLLRGGSLKSPLSVRVFTKPFHPESQRAVGALTITLSFDL